jgi:hypothetical protein
VLVKERRKMSGLTYVARAFNKMRELNNDAMEVVSHCCSHLQADIIYLGVNIYPEGASEIVRLSFPDDTVMKVTNFYSFKTQRFSASFKAE